jgi:UPF0271 protein
VARSIDLNCDMGEGYDSDAVIIAHVTSVNIACGYHAGDTETMRKTIRLAMEHGVAIGAHPGLPDREHFGRREMLVTWTAVYDMIFDQVTTLKSLAREQGASITHLKPHGALYNMAARDIKIAQAIVSVTGDLSDLYGECVLVGPAGSQLIKAGENAGLKTASEAFADRTYQADGSLTPRDSADALIHDPAAAAERVLKMVLQGTVSSQQGTEIPLRVDTICIHGDSPGAADMAKTIRERLQQAGIDVKSMAGIAGSGRKP